MKYCDFLSFGPYFMIDNQYNISSNFGGVLSLMVVGVIFFFTWDLGKDIIYKQVPNVIQRNDLLPYYPIFNLNKTNMLLAIRIEDLNGNALSRYGFDDSFAKVEMIYSEYIQKNSSINEPGGDIDYDTKDTYLQIGNCSFMYPYFMNISRMRTLETSICPIEEQFNLTLTGDWTTTEMKYLQAILKKCKNQTDINGDIIPNTTVCKSKAEINEMIQGAYLNIYYSDSIVIPGEFEQPIKRILKNSYLLLDSSIYKDVEIYLGTVSMISDQGWLLSEIRYDNYSIFSEIHVDMSTAKTAEEEDAIVMLNIYQNNRANIYQRNYIKIQAVCANVGGIMRVLILCAQIINYRYNLKSVNLKIMSSIFNYKNSFNCPISNTFTLDDDNDRHSLKLLKVKDKKNAEMDNADINKQNEEIAEDLKSNEKPANFLQKKIKKRLELNKIEKNSAKSTTIASAGHLLGIYNDEERKNSNGMEIQESLRKKDTTGIQPVPQDDKIEINFSFCANANHASEQCSLPKNNPGSSKKFIRSRQSKTRTIELKRLNMSRIQDIETNSGLKYSFLQLLNSAFCFPRLRTAYVRKLDALYDASLPDIHNYLNINHLVTKIFELEKIKLLLFNRKQLLCFNFFDKPQIRLTDQNIRKQLSMLFNQTVLSKDERKMKDVINYFLNKFPSIEDIDQENVDYKLFKMLNVDLRKKIMIEIEDQFQDERS